MTPKWQRVIIYLVTFACELTNRYFLQWYITLIPLPFSANHRHALLFNMQLSALVCKLNFKSNENDMHVSSQMENYTKNTFRQVN